MNKFLLIEDHILNISQIEMIKIKPDNLEIIFRGKGNQYRIAYQNYESIEKKLPNFLRFSYILKKEDGYIADVILELSVPVEDILEIYTQGGSSKFIKMISGKKYNVVEGFYEMAESLEIMGLLV